MPQVTNLSKAHDSNILRLLLFGCIRETNSHESWWLCHIMWGAGEGLTLRGNLCFWPKWSHMNSHLKWRALLFNSLVIALFYLSTQCTYDLDSWSWNQTWILAYMTFYCFHIMERTWVYKEHCFLGKDRRGKEKPIFIEYLLCTKNREEHFPNTSSFSLYRSLVRN